MSDLIVHKRSGKSGRVIEERPYRLHIKNDVALYERPPGSGIMHNLQDNYFVVNEEATKVAQAKLSEEQKAKAAAKEAERKAAAEKAAKALKAERRQSVASKNAAQAEGHIEAANKEGE